MFGQPQGGFGGFGNTGGGLFGVTLSWQTHDVVG